MWIFILTIYSNMIMIKYGVSILIMILISTKRKYLLWESNPGSLSYLLAPGFNSWSWYFRFMLINLLSIIHIPLLWQMIYCICILIQNEANSLLMSYNTLLTSKFPVAWETRTTNLSVFRLVRFRYNKATHWLLVRFVA